MDGNQPRYDPQLPPAVRSHDFGSNLWHVFDLPNQPTACCLAAFKTGRLQLLRLDPIIEVMQEWTPETGSGQVFDVLVGPASQKGDCSVILTTVSRVKGKTLLYISSLSVDPRKFWFELKGSCIVVKEKCNLIQVSGGCTSAYRFLAALWDSGDLSLTTLPQEKSDAADTRILVQLDKADVQLLAAPNRVCCSLNYYSPDYIFVLFYSRERRAAVAQVYNVQLNSLQHTQILSGSADWQQLHVTTAMQPEEMRVEVQQKGSMSTVKTVNVQVPTASSKLLDLFSESVRPVDTPVQNPSIINLNASLAELDKAGTIDPVEAVKTLAASNASDNASRQAMTSIAKCCKDRQFAKVRGFAADMGLVVEADIPGFLEWALQKEDRRSDVVWYFTKVLGIRAHSLIAGFKYAVHLKANAPQVMDAVLFAAGRCNDLSLAGLEVSEIIFVLKFICKTVYRCIHTTGREVKSCPNACGISDLLVVATSLLDANFLDLIAADAEHQKVLSTFHGLCASYIRYIEDLGQLNGALSAVAADKETRKRTVDSRDLSLGQFCHPKPPEGQYLYYQIQPKC